MDRRYKAYQKLETQFRHTKEEAPEDTVKANLLTEGRDSEFWQVVTEELNQQIRSAEARFLDVLAKDYDTYVAFWSRRQALIGVLAIPTVHTQKEP